MKGEKIMLKETSCPKCSNTQFYIEKLLPLYLFDESRAMVCGKCGYVPSYSMYKKDINRERQKLLWKKEKCRVCGQPLDVCVHMPTEAITR